MTLTADILAKMRNAPENPSFGFFHPLPVPHAFNKPHWQQG